MAGMTVYDIPVNAGIDQHPEAIGRIAVEMLVKQLNAASVTSRWIRAAS
jgi:DNA-binding LacI/PurR family transcriptional regulator